VCKPRHGAGSQATFLVRGASDLAACRARAAAEGYRGELVVQPFVPGLAASVALLGGPAGWFPLPAARQCLSEDGRFRYRGGGLPLPARLGARARRLAERAARAVPGLGGYVGVDLVLGEGDGADDAVIEINPRLTTSYVGLRALARCNLAEALLEVAAGRAPALRWGDWEVDFTAEGAVEDRARGGANSGLFSEG
jgi:predicted ATP-grasp superfamily ATP-dependent carboligase